MAIGVLKIPLGTSLNGTKQRLHKDLHELTHRVNQARNATLWSWMAWCKANGYAPVQQFDNDGKPKTIRGKPMFQFAPLPNKMKIDETISCRACRGKGKVVLCEKCEKKNTLCDKCQAKVLGTTCKVCEGFGVKDYMSGSGWLYRQASEIVTDIPGAVISSITDREWDKLKDKLPRDHGGIGSLRWHAYLLHECQLPNSRGSMIPCPRSISAIVYNGIASNNVNKKFQVFGKSDCVLILPIWGKESGRDDKTMVVRLRIGALTDGERAIIRRVCRGEWKFADSSIVYHDDDKHPAWYLHLVYEQPEKELGLSIERMVILSCTPNADRPFRLQCGEFGRPAGKVRTLLVRRENLENKRVYLRNHYKDSAARRGHGRQRIEINIRPITRRLGNLMVEFRRQLVADAISFCIRNDCGKLVYREPTLGARNHSWFAKHGLQIDWTAINSALVQKCQLHGIKLEVINERRCGDEKPEDARPTQSDNNQTNAENYHNNGNGNGKHTLNGKPLANGTENRVRSAVKKAHHSKR